MATTILIIIAILFYVLLGTRSWRLFRASQQTQGEHSKTLQFLALNLAEPMLNTPLLAFLYGFTNNLPNDQNVYRLFVTLPMAILALPILGWHFQELRMRDISRSLFWRGILRWLAVFMPLSAVNLFRSDFIDFLAIFGPFIALGLLIHSYVDSGQKLKGLLQPVLPPLMPPYGVQAMIVQARTAMPIEPERVPELNYNNATPCPICHKLVWLEHSTCPACGLMLTSRIPTELHSIPRYDVLRPLGSGGMSAVYLARDRAGGHLFVLKTLALVDKGHSTQWYNEATLCLQHEADVLRGMQHPGLPAFEGWYATSWGYFMTMAYVPGPALDRTLTHVDAHGQLQAGGPMHAQHVASIGAQIAETLHMLHSQPHPIIHCDIKPANLIVPEHSYPVLVDFGSSAVLHDSARMPLPGNRYGTPGYAAPEQYQGHIDPRSDVYALAATLYHLATDDDPTQHPLRFPRLSQLPQGLAEVLAEALQRDAWQRPDAQRFGEVLRAVSTSA